MIKANRTGAALFVALTLIATQSGCTLQNAQSEQASAPQASPVSVGSTHSALYTGGASEVLLQGFTWGTQGGTYAKINSSAQAISDAGFTMVWFPPPNSAPTFAVQGYLPVRWNLGVTASGTNYYYGTQDELKGAISALHARGVKALADIVINHRIGPADWADFQDPGFGAGTANGNADNNAAVCSGDEYPSASGNPDTGEGYAAARDLDHRNANVQTAIKNWLNYLKDPNNAGFDGWRYDFVKGYWGRAVGDYNDATNPTFSVGEFWPTNSFQDGNPGDWRGQITNWINGNNGTGSKSAAFDFVTKPLLQDAINGNNYALLSTNGGSSGAVPNGLIGTMPGFAVTFLDNHDTAPSPGGQNLWPFSSGAIEQGYAYILTHPGTPSVFWSHYFDQGSSQQAKIKSMIALRKAQGITNVSSVSIKRAEGGLYAAVINGNTAVKIGPNGWDPASAGVAPPSGSSWPTTATISGSNYAIWAATGATPPPTDGGTPPPADGGSTGPTANNPSMFLRGSMNSWGVTNPMTLVSNNTWQVTVALAASTGYQYKYEVNGNPTNLTQWGTNWGTGSNAGTAAPNGGNITYTTGAAGNYVFTFNDATFAYTVTAPAATPTPPQPPAQVFPQVVSSTAMTVTWTASAGATTYTVYRSLTSAGTYAAIPAGTNLTGTSFADSGLSPGTTYFYKVSAANAAGPSALSSAGSAATLPSSPATVSATATSSSSITVTWSASTGATAYTVYRSLINNNAGDFAPVSGSQAGTSFVDTGLSANTTYFYKVQAANNSGPADVSTATGTATTLPSTQPPPPVPEVPTGVTVAASGSSLVVSWAAVTGAISYRVSRATASAGPFTVLSSTVTGPSYTDATVAAGTTYFYVVAATTPAGISANSAVASLTTPSAGVVTTTIRVHYDTGYGNRIAIRGDTSPLNWSAGANATWTTGNIWVWTTTAIPRGASFQYKPLINDSRWSTGGNFSGTAGNTYDIMPGF
jgi:alpha-amylase